MQFSFRVGALFSVALTVSVLASCAVDSRDVGSATGEAQPGGPMLTSCANGAAGCSATPAAVGAAAPNATCSNDTECSARAPTCTGSVCTCQLSLAEIATDPNNCGSCGNDCGSAQTGATCQRGRCVRPGEPGPTDIARLPSGGEVALSLAAASGVVLRSARFSLQLSPGQAPGGNAVLSSSRYRLHGGFIGASN